MTNQHSPHYHAILNNRAETKLLVNETTYKAEQKDICLNLYLWAALLLVEAYQQRRELLLIRFKHRPNGLLKLMWKGKCGMDSGWRMERYKSLDALKPHRCPCPAPLRRYIGFKSNMSALANGLSVSIMGQASMATPIDRSKVRANK